MTIKERLEEIPDNRRVALALRLVKSALPIWEDHCAGKPLEYQDPVVGMQYLIAADLLQRSVSAAELWMRWPRLLRRLKSRTDLIRVMNEFDDPIVSLQDLDIEWPEPVKLTFHAVYNLVEHLIKGGRSVFGDRVIYVAVNQAMDALIRSGRIDDVQLEQWLQEA